MPDTPIHFLCTHCLGGVTASPHHAGLTGRCPRCRGVMTIPGPPRAADPADRLAAVDFDCGPGPIYPPPDASCPGLP